MKQNGYRIGVHILCLGAAILAFMPSKAHAMRFCQFDDPKYQLKLATTKTKYIRTKSARDLTEMHGTRGGVVGGLGGGEMGFQVRTKYEIMEQGGQYCVGLSAVQITLYGKPEVHIASNFKRGTCEYTAVLGHEQKHIRTMRKFMREYAVKFKKEVRRISKTTQQHIGPISKNQIEKAQTDLQNIIIQRLSAYFDKVSPILAARQKAVDNPDEYARVFAKCDGWDEKFARSR